MLGAGHERASHREHLLLAAGERAALLLQAVAEPREEREHVLEVPGNRFAVGAREGPQLEVLEHGHRREDPAALGGLGDAEPGDAVGGHPVDPPAAEAHGRLAAGAPSRARSCSVVVLPAPFEPIRVTISPRPTLSDTPLSARMLP